MNIEAHHVRANASLYFRNIDLQHTEIIGDFLGKSLAQFLGDSHVRNQDGNSYWFAECYHDESDALAPIILRVDPAEQWYIDCHAGDLDFITNCLQNDVFRTAIADAGELTLSHAPSFPNVFMMG